MQHLLVAGGTGYLGRYILQTLLDDGYEVTAIVRSPHKLDDLVADKLHVIRGEATDAQSLAGCCDGVDAVISTLGITRQKDGLTYDDVDYQANLNLMMEARRAGVKRFMYVSVLHGDKLKSTRLGLAKETFVEALKQSGLDYCVIRPNGFFSDMCDFLDMARGGRVYLFGKGENKLNPIHGADLARVCVDAVDTDKREIEAGGPDLFSQRQLAELAFDVLGKPVRITSLPDGLRRAAVWLLPKVTRQSVYGPVEFFLTGMAMDMQAPAYGKHHLRDYFIQHEKTKQAG